VCNSQPLIRIPPEILHSNAALGFDATARAGVNVANIRELAAGFWGKHSFPLQNTRFVSFLDKTSSAGRLVAALLRQVFPRVLEGAPQVHRQRGVSVKRAI